MSLRGLFSHSRVQAMKPGAASEITLPDGRKEMMNAPPVNDGNLQHQFLNGAVTYQRPDDAEFDPLETFGATLQDVAAGLVGREPSALSQLRESALKRQQRAAQRKLAQQLYGNDPTAMLAFETDPDSIAKAWVESQRPKKRESYKGEDGIYEKNDDGVWEKVKSLPRAAPQGWEWSAEGALKPTKDGPYDPDYIARVSGVRREAIVQRPMPRAGRSGGGGGGRGGATGLPAGFSLRRQ